LIATFWIKAKPFRFGAYWDNLTPELRKSIGSNKGVCIIVVVRNSPAFEADLLVGDIIRKFNDVEIVGAEHFNKTLNKCSDRTIQLEIFRQGEKMVKEVTFFSL